MVMSNAAYWAREAARARQRADGAFEDHASKQRALKTAEHYEMLAQSCAQKWSETIFDIAVAMSSSDDKPKSPQGSDLAARQCRMARAKLNLGVRQLADAAGVSSLTITRLERGETLYPRVVAAVRGALEAAGVEFTNGDAPGVTLNSDVLK
jgi:DNA-binding XRE family transcriptional regulator